jgi:hypothetical protein
MSGEFYDTENASATPSISKETAFKKAINHIGASKYLWENPENALKIGYHKPEGELVFLPSMIDQGEKTQVHKFA